MDILTYYVQKWKIEEIQNPKLLPKIYVYNTMLAKLKQFRKMENYYRDLSEITINEMIKLSSELLKDSD